jgi:uncharacterized sporulation protein YeaH/YhbH (DUF444 family)
MLNVIDRRLAGKNKTIENRERFLRRYREQIRQKVADAIRDQSLHDVGADKSITIPKRDISEPVFRHGKGGTRNIVHAGNKQYVAGDRIKRPDGGQGGKPQASDDGEGEDDFTFELTREEFMNYLFEDLELPRLARTEAIQVPEFKTTRAGFSASGAPTNLHVVRSLRNALGRRIALMTPLSRALAELEAERDRRAAEPESDVEALAVLDEEIARLKGRIGGVPYLDPTDLRFVNRVRVPQPCVQAVMFCVMDVSGSMDQARKDLAKRFFLMLYLFLTRSYERVEVVFIRHHTQAEEVDEDTFFHGTRSGGTVVFSALDLADKIRVARYARGWNVYIAQASDGDAFGADPARSARFLREKLLPATRYYAYLELAPAHMSEHSSALWAEYERVADAVPNLAMRRASEREQIYPVFRELFRKESH